MITVREPIKEVISLLSAQEIDLSSVYRRNTFCLTEEIDGVLVAYNSLTGEIVELRDEEKNLLNSESVCPSDKAEELIKRWFLVPKDHKDLRLCDEVRSFLRMFENFNAITQYTIFTTTDCNARCFYCYELGRPRIPMSAETADKVADFILKNHNGRPVILSWFGGEPLYNSSVIDIITERLAVAGVKYTSNMISNAYLFDDAIVEKAKEKWKLSHVQITLDGTAEVYNRTKAFINNEGKNAFKIVTDNIERLLKNDIRVSVRMNMGAHNSNNLFELVEWLGDRYKGYNNITAYPHLLFESEHSSPLDNDIQLVLAKDLIDLKKLISSKGLSNKKGVSKKLRMLQCMADGDDCITITSTGKLGKCEHFTEDNFIGDIDSGITDTEMVAAFKVPANSEKLCEGCPAYPQCVIVKKCPDSGVNHCNVANRYIMVDELRRRLINTYMHYKNTKKES